MLCRLPNFCLRYLLLHEVKISQYLTKMLRHSTKFLVSHQRLLHLSRTLNQIDIKAVSDDKEKLVPARNFQEKVMNASNAALTRYNEIVGFTEIEEAYQKVTGLQVKSAYSIRKF